MKRKYVIALRIAVLLALAGGTAFERYLGDNPNYFNNKIYPHATHSTTESASPAGTQPFVVDPKAEYSVIRVVDGDTIVLGASSTQATVRLIGINTPEVVDPRRAVQCFGKEASEKAKSILTGVSVKIEEDPSQGVLDKYGRHLLYVFLPDGTNFGKLMIAEGYAFEYTYHVPYKYQAEFKAAAIAAREANKGLWSPEACAGQLKPA